MANTIELTVPDLGGFEDVPIIDIFIASGDTIGKDAPLVMLESDKATMEVPAAVAGIVREIKVKIGDRVSAGSVLADVEVASNGAVSTSAHGPVSESAAAAPPAPIAAATTDRPPTADGTPTTAVAAAPSREPLELTVPDLGGFSDVPVISVFIAVGDAIGKDAPLVELESDKATMEVPALEGGTVRDVRVKVGDRVSPGTVLATVERVAARNGSAPQAPAPRAAESSPSTVAPLPNADRPETSVAASATNAPAAPAAPPTTSPSNGASNGISTGAPSHASPAIRRFARELGVNVGGVSGTGPNGRITREDIQNYVKKRLTEAAAPSTAPASSGSGLHLIPWPKIDFAKFGPIDRRPLSRIAKLAGQNLARNWVMIPHVTQHEDADVTDLEAFRKSINAEQNEVKVTMLALLMKALIATLRQYPTFNSSLDGDELILKRYYHIGFAADTPSGLVVPVIRDVDRKGILEIALETSALAKKARDGKLGPADMTGSGFTISSLGGIGGTSFTPIINAPEVAILGVSRTITKPVWTGSAFEPRLMLPLSLSYDHRVIDGAAAARFCTYLAGVLADMRKTLL